MVAGPATASGKYGPPMTEKTWEEMIEESPEAVRERLRTLHGVLSMKEGVTVSMNARKYANVRKFFASKLETITDSEELKRGNMALVPDFDVKIRVNQEIPDWHEASPAP